MQQHIAHRDKDNTPQSQHDTVTPVHFHKKDETMMGKMDAQNIFQKKRFTDSHLQKETPPELPVLDMKKITTESSSSRTVRAKPQSPLWIGSKLASFRVSRSSGRASEAATRAKRAVAPRRYRTMKFCHFL